jgi:hypothetical protein
MRISQGSMDRPGIDRDRRVCTDELRGIYSEDNRQMEGSA